MALPMLEKVLAYRNPAVIRFFAQTYPEHTLPGDIALRETLKYLWLTQKHAQDVAARPDAIVLPRNCIMLRSMQAIDDMWHAFILFTEEYTRFCHALFGRYIHHVPDLPDNMPVNREAQNAEIARLLPYIFEHLGEETMRIWFAAYL